MDVSHSHTYDTESGRAITITINRTDIDLYNVHARKHKFNMSWVAVPKLHANYITDRCTEAIS